MRPPTPSTSNTAPISVTAMSCDSPAKSRGVKTGDEITLTAGAQSVTLRARVNLTLRDGIVRVPDEHAGGLQGFVDVRTGVTA